MSELIERTRRILFSPRDALTRSIVERGELRAQAPFVASLMGFGAVARFVSGGVLGSYLQPQRLFGVEVGGGWVREPLPALFAAAFSFATMMVAWWLLGLMLNLLAPEFGARRDRAGATKTATFMMTPIAVAGVLAILDSLPRLGTVYWIIQAAAVGYGGLIGTWALPLLMGTPEAKSSGHVIGALGVTTLAAGGVGLATYHLLTGSLLGGALQ